MDKEIPTREPDIKIDGYLAIWVVLDEEGCFDHNLAVVRLKDGQEITYADNAPQAAFLRSAQDVIVAQLLDIYATRI